MIISIKSSGSGSSRGLIHYLAHSKLDRAKEGAERREFFNESEDDLDVSRANRHLSLTGAKPNPEELLHIVVAPSKEEIERIGGNLNTRKNALKEIVRATARQLEKEVKAKKLRWVAASHFNTDNPHAHLAIQKEFLSESGEPEKLRIKRQMLHYNERGEHGEKITHKGALIVTAENKVEEIARNHQTSQEIQKTSQPEKTTEKTETQSEKAEEILSIEPAKIPNFLERRILAEEMLVAAEIAQRTRNIENLVAHGDKKRFKIKDEQTGITRHVSLFDIGRKIEIVSRRKGSQKYPKNTEMREKFTASAAEEERSKHDPLIRGLETIRRHVLGFENRHLFQAQEKHTRLNNQKLLIEKKYERLQTDVPLPIFEPDEIERLQSEAIREQNTEKILQLEKIRQNNASELNRPSRRDDEVRALLGAKIIAELKARAAEKRLEEFPKTKDFMKVKIGDSFWSHSELQRHENRAAQKSSFWKQIKSKTNTILFPSGNELQPAEKLDYPALHKTVGKALENLENSRRAELSKLIDLSQTLDKIFDASENPNKNQLTPAFSVWQLSESEDLALDAGSESFYEDSLTIQETWLREKMSGASVSNESLTAEKIKPEGSAEKVIGNFVVGRAKARIILAQTKADQAEKNLADYIRSKFFIRHPILSPKTGEIRELSLHETEPKEYHYLLDRLLDRMLESKGQKQEHDAVRKAAQEKEIELKQNLNDSQNRVSRLENQQTAMFEKFAGGRDVQPIFTPKEIAALDAWKNRTNDKSEAAGLEKIITAAEKNNRVGKLQDFLESTAKDLEVFGQDLIENLEAKISHESDTTRRQSINESSREISKQNFDFQRTETSNLQENKSEKIETEKAIVREKGRTR
ncbi:MAG: hypothetical protein WA584_02225 [Pyrinomonadaceae bacterium]